MPDTDRDTAPDRVTGRRGPGTRGRPSSQRRRPPTFAERQAAAERKQAKAEARSDDEHATWAWNYAVWLLGKSPRTRADLARRLRDKWVPDPVAEQVLDRLESYGYVNDREYADAFVRSRQASRGITGPVLRHELRARGVPDDIVTDVITGLDPDTERDRAVAWATRRARTLTGQPAPVAARRLAGMLTRKGFPASLAWDVTRDVLAIDPHDTEVQ